VFLGSCSRERNRATTFRNAPSVYQIGALVLTLLFNSIMSLSSSLLIPMPLGFTREWTMKNP